MKKNYDIIFLSQQAIGNTIEMLYAIEYCLVNNIKVGIYISKPNKSFKDYLVKCYGEDVILDSQKDIVVDNIIHTCIFEDKIEIEYKNYIYINPNSENTKYLSETEQYLSIVRALYPSDYNSFTLEYLISKESDRVKALNIKDKYILYTGCSSFAPVRRWSRYMELIDSIGEDNIIVVGGNDDLNDNYGYVYPKFIPKISPYKLTNRKSFWNICHKLNLLLPYSHNDKISNLDCSYFDIFDWEELVYIFKNSKYFIGNDGGLMHLASASGSKGVAIFGASSVEKNKSYNPQIKEVYKNYECQPCQFNLDRVHWGKYFISCPYGVKCLEDISCDEVLKVLDEI